MNFFEFFIQLILFFNIIQIIIQNSFYYSLGYFILFVFYVGFYLILFDLDIACILLWIIYGGVIVIFFLYSLLWFDNYKNIKNIKNYKIFFLFLFFPLFFYFYDNSNFLVKTPFIIYWLNFYEFLFNDTIEELELLGWGILYYSTFFFLIISYMLFLVCCISIVIILNSKKIKYFDINLYYIFFKKKNFFFFFNFMKYQNFFSQEYENINQLHSLYKNFKISQKFHKFKKFNKKI